MNELADSVFTDVPSYLEAVFPVSGDLLDMIMNDVLKRAGLYNKTKNRWVDYPADPKNYERHSYKPRASGKRGVSMT